MILVICLGVYLFIGLLMTIFALRDKRILEDLNHHNFIAKIGLLMGFIVSSPILFMRAMYEILKELRR